METSSYHIKGALGDNFTYNHSNKPSHGTYGHSGPTGKLGHSSNGGRLRGPPQHQPYNGQRKSMHIFDCYHKRSSECVQECSKTGTIIMQVSHSTVLLHCIGKFLRVAIFLDVGFSPLLKPSPPLSSPQTLPPFPSTNVLYYLNCSQHRMAEVVGNVQCHSVTQYRSLTHVLTLVRWTSCLPRCGTVVARWVANRKGRLAPDKDYPINQVIMLRAYLLASFPDLPSAFQGCSHEKCVQEKIGESVDEAREHIYFISLAS